jgi:hypothetical protein
MMSNLLKCRKTPVHFSEVFANRCWRLAARVRPIMKNVVFWDVALRRSCVNRRFGGTYRLHLQGRKIRERRTSVARRLQSTLKMEAIRSSETSVNTRPTQRHIPENDILHSHRCESLRSYKTKHVCADSNFHSIASCVTVLVALKTLKQLWFCATFSQHVSQFQSF